MHSPSTGPDPIEVVGGHCAEHVVVVPSGLMLGVAFPLGCKALGEAVAGERDGAAVMRSPSDDEIFRTDCRERPSKRPRGWRSPRRFGTIKSLAENASADTPLVIPTEKASRDGLNS